MYYLKYNVKKKMKKTVTKQIMLKLNNSQSSNHQQKIINSLKNENDQLRDVIETDFINGTIPEDINMNDADYEPEHKLSNLEKIKLIRLSQLSSYKD